jgi:hypothetical protein
MEPATAKAGPSKKGKAKRKANNSDWSWEDEMLMYDVTQRDAHKKKKRLENDSITDEMRALKREKVSYKS